MQRKYVENRWRAWRESNPPTHGLEACQFLACFPPVAGPEVRSRVRIVSGAELARPDYRPGSSAPYGSSSTCCRPHARGEPPSRTPGAGTVWTPRYTMRRIAWHALDPVSQIEDRAPTPETIRVSALLATLEPVLESRSRFRHRSRQVADRSVREMVRDSNLSMLEVGQGTGKVTHEHLTGPIVY
jgi:hypothetical protein